MSVSVVRTLYTSAGDYGIDTTEKKATFVGSHCHRITYDTTTVPSLSDLETLSKSVAGVSEMLTRERKRLEEELRDVTQALEALQTRQEALEAQTQRNEEFKEEVKAKIQQELAEDGPFFRRFCALNDDHLLHVQMEVEKVQKLGNENLRVVQAEVEKVRKFGGDSLRAVQAEGEKIWKRGNECLHAIQVGGEKVQKLGADSLRAVQAEGEKTQKLGGDCVRAIQTEGERVRASNKECLLNVQVGREEVQRSAISARQALERVEKKSVSFWEKLRAEESRREENFRRQQELLETLEERCRNLEAETQRMRLEGEENGRTFWRRLAFLFRGPRHAEEKGAPPLDEGNGASDGGTEEGNTDSGAGN